MLFPAREGDLRTSRDLSEDFEIDGRRRELDRERKLADRRVSEEHGLRGGRKVEHLESRVAQTPQERCPGQSCCREARTRELLGHVLTARRSAAELFEAHSV